MHQTEWGWLIAVYLFLGGLGGATVGMAYWLGRTAALTGELQRRLMRFAQGAAMASVAVGTLFLVVDLVNPWHLMYTLLNPTSWIFWGVLLLTAFLVIGVVYLWFDLRRDVVLPRLLAWNSVIGMAVALYTGFLVSQAPDIPFWNTPALPLLFVVSAASTGAALVLLYTLAMRKTWPWLDALAGRLERVDAALIGGEILILLAFFNYFRLAPEAARLSAAYLLGSPGFLVGFAFLGLLVPWAIEIWQMVQHGRSQGGEARPNHVLTSLAAVLVLMGGFLLRYYVLAAGIFGYPFPHI